MCVCVCVCVCACACQEDLLGSLLSLYAYVQNGLSTAAQPPPHLTAGKLSKVCPHKVRLTLLANAASYRC